MVRAIWSGSISFGMVNIPVKLVTAVRRKSVSFHQIHEPTHARVRQRRVSEATGDEVPYDEIAKGYEVSPGQYVVIEREELAALDPEKSKTIEIEEFVDLDEIDPLYYDSQYYLVPERTARKPYRLLHQALTRTERVAIGRFVLRSKEYLAALRPLDGAIAISTMVYADEIVSTSDLEGLPDEDEVELSDREVEMAVQLVDSLAAAFEPEKYTDTHREKILELIERKVAGEEIVVTEEADEPEAAEVVDLMAALEESLDAAKRRSESA